ncbi:hypothetical protein KIN20_028023 [Parelaphostrongylus tenuis]|uniref:Uncharacterized protein n=1 Tax=Parelaphostrongylus tenuis TaxID=148309 RepID=A0AAD5R0H1_PARTN|nr:hypothetical protein KIN20_028023 [Parelaphostrongylus tenuis]
MCARIAEEVVVSGISVILSRSRSARESFSERFWAYYIPRNRSNCNGQGRTIHLAKLSFKISTLQLNPKDYQKRYIGTHGERNEKGETPCKIKVLDDDQQSRDTPCTGFI